MSRENSSSGGRRVLLSPGKLMTDCEISGRYNSARAHFFRNCHNGILFLIILSGSAAFADLLPESWAPWVYLVPAILASLDLVFGLSRKASRHDITAMKFWQLHGEIVADTKPADDVLGEWNRRIHGLYGEEVAAYHVLQAVCHNETVIAMNERKHVVKISFWRNALKQWFRFPSFKGEFVQKG